MCFFPPHSCQCCAYGNTFKMISFNFVKYVCSTFLLKTLDILYRFIRDTSDPYTLNFWSIATYTYRIQPQWLLRILPISHVKIVFQLKTLTLISIPNLILGSNTLYVHRECEIKMKVCDVPEAEGWFSSAGKRQWLPVLFWMCHRVHLHYVEGLSFVVTLERAPNPLWPIIGRAAVWVSTKAFK